MLEAGVAISFALQFGATVPVIRSAFPRDTEGIPEGPLGTLFDILGKEVITP